MKGMVAVIPPADLRRTLLQAQLVSKFRNEPVRELPILRFSGFPPLDPAAQPHAQGRQPPFLPDERREDPSRFDRSPLAQQIASIRCCPAGKKVVATVPTQYDPRERENSVAHFDVALLKRFM